MHRFDADGPAYPYVIIPESAKVAYMKNEGPDNDEVINQAPGQMPADYFDGKSLTGLSAHCERAASASA